MGHFLYIIVLVIFIAPVADRDLVANVQSARQSVVFANLTELDNITIGLKGIASLLYYKANYSFLTHKDCSFIFIIIVIIGPRYTT